MAGAWLCSRCLSSLRSLPCLPRTVTLSQHMRTSHGTAQGYLPSHSHLYSVSEHLTALRRAAFPAQSPAQHDLSIMRRRAGLREVRVQRGGARAGGPAGQRLQRGLRPAGRLVHRGHQLHGRHHLRRLARRQAQGHHRPRPGVAPPARILGIQGSRRGARLAWQHAEMASPAARGQARPRAHTLRLSRVEGRGAPCGATMSACITPLLVAVRAHARRPVCCMTAGSLLEPDDLRLWWDARRPRAWASTARARCTASRSRTAPAATSSCCRTTASGCT